MSDLVDALPYIDHEYNDPQVRVLVAQMIEDETKRYKQTKNYLDTLSHLPPLEIDKFETEILKNEFNRLKNGQSMELLNMKRYELPSPAPGKFNDVFAWHEALNNSQAQLEHQAIRIENLELMEIYGAEAWKSYNSILSKLLEKSKSRLEKLKKEIQEVNLSRKNSQMSAGEKIKILEESWVTLISKNYEIERACVQLESDITKLEKEMNSLEK